MTQVIPFLSTLTVTGVAFGLMAISMHREADERRTQQTTS